MLGSPLEPITELIVDIFFLAQVTVLVPFYGSGFKFSQKVIGHSHSICATNAPMSLNRQARHYCGSQGSQLGKTFLP